MSTTPEKQRRLQNLLSAGNLAANYTSAKKLKEISHMIKLKLEEERKQTKLKEKITRRNNCQKKTNETTRRDKSKKTCSNA